MHGPISMDTFDRVFQILFARFRRRYGDSQIQFAWRRAGYTMTIYTTFAVSACVAISVIYGCSLLKIGTPAEHRKFGGIAAGVVVLLVSFLFDGRFRKYLSSPPLLSSQETEGEARYVLSFCAVSFGIFLLICLIAYFLHSAGIGLS
jgi:hypothetical protein